MTGRRVIAIVGLAGGDLAGSDLASGQEDEKYEAAEHAATKVGI